MSNFYTLHLCESVHGGLLITSVKISNEDFGLCKIYWSKHIKATQIQSNTLIQRTTNQLTTYHTATIPSSSCSEMFHCYHTAALSKSAIVTSATRQVSRLTTRVSLSSSYIYLCMSLRCGLPLHSLYTVLTATFIPMGIGKFNPLQNQLPLNQSTKHSAQLITSARGFPIPNLVQIYPLRASGQMGEI